jgi:hypothetical protein
MLEVTANPANGIRHLRIGSELFLNGGHAVFLHKPTHPNLKALHQPTSKPQG